MIRVTFFTKNTLLVILLASTTANPLLAFPIKKHSIVKKNQENSNISQKIETILVDKGLDEEVAFHQVSKLFKGNNTDKLNQILNNSDLSISKEKLNDALVKYALYEKKLDLNSYDSLVGLLQRVSLHPLENKQLTYIKNIASLS